MYFSPTSYIMAILGGNCLICFLCIIMRNNCITQKLSIGFLRYFSFLILLRLILPFEFFHTITVPSKKILPAIIDFCNEQFLFTIWKIDITPFRLLFAIWSCGVIYIAFSTFKKYKALYNIIYCFPNLLDSPNNDVSAILAALYKVNPVRHPVKKVIRTKYINTPCIIGFCSPVVFLPNLEFTREELYCIFYHELSHLRHIDLIYMVFMETLCIIYWWNPFMILLKAQLTNIMEFHADKTTYANLSPEQRTLYLKCMIKVSRSQQSNSSLPAISLPFFYNTHSSLKCRILRLIEPKPDSSLTNFFIKSITILLFIVSTSFIIEPSWIPENGTDNTFSITDNSYLLMRSDGTYEVYIDEVYMGTIHNPNIEEIRDLPIYSKK